MAEHEAAHRYTVRSPAAARMPAARAPAGAVGPVPGGPTAAGRAAAVLALQRSAGNRAVASLLRTTRRPDAMVARPPALTPEPEVVRRDQSGEQLNVQAKMAEITELFRKKAKSEEETTATYASEMAINGLCGGWVELFMEYPDWVEPVYNAVRTWERSAHLADDDALLDFERHLRKTTRFEGAGNVVALLRDAYDAMSRLEPDAGYDDLPNWTSDVEDGRGEPTATAAVEPREQTVKLKGGQNAAERVCAEVKKLTDPERPGECMAHLESDAHHMALRVQKIRRKGTKLGLVITVVETEERGMVKVDSWAKAQPILDTYLSTEETLTEVELRTRTVGF